MTDFASIASFYDKMTGFQGRLVNDFAAIKHLVNRLRVKTALDAGCGTGVHTIILAKLGVDVLGFDASVEMIDLARTNALKEGVHPKLAQEYYETIPEEWWGKYDAIFCLANSLVGVENDRRLSLAMKSFHRALKPGGHAIVQLLNTAAFIRTGQRIIKVSSVENFTFVRFFDFDKDETRLNIIAIEHDMGQVKHQFISSRILPIDDAMMKSAAETAGFSGTEFYSDLILTESFSADAVNLIALLTK